MNELHTDEEDLLLELAALHRATPTGQDRTLVLLEDHSIKRGEQPPDCVVRRPGGGSTPVRCYLSSFEGLIAAGYVRDTARLTSSVRRFNVTVAGLAAADQLRFERGHVERIEASVRSLLDPGSFSDRYPEAWAQWSAAMALVDSDAVGAASAVGNHCRDAVTAFAPSWCAAAGGGCDAPAEKQKKHVSAGLLALRPVLGDRSGNYLDALYKVWESLIDLVMRQSHARGKEGKDLDEEDNRMVAFHTGLVMFELDRALQRATDTPTAKG